MIEGQNWNTVFRIMFSFAHNHLKPDMWTGVDFSHCFDDFTEKEMT